MGRTARDAVRDIAGSTDHRKQCDAGECVQAVFSELCGTQPDLVVASANGTFIDEAERGAVSAHCPKARVYAIKAALGESVGASTLWQTIGAAQALLTQRLPSISRRDAPFLS